MTKLQNVHLDDLLDNLLDDHAITSTGARPAMAGTLRLVMGPGAPPLPHRGRPRPPSAWQLIVELWPGGQGLPLLCDQSQSPAGRAGPPGGR